MVYIGELYNDDYFGDIRPILFNNEEVGIIDYNETKHSINVIFITIHASYRKLGIATSVIKLLMKENPGKNITGLSEHGVSEKFWKSLGATFTPDPEEPFYIPFILKGDC